MILRIHVSKSTTEVTKYFCENRPLENYYSADGQEIRGNWGGRGAAMLGLKGEYTNEAFSRLVNNLHPVTGEKLTPRMRGNRRPGFDINFNCPKSVSLLYAWTKDERIIWALRQAQHETLLEMESKAATRVRLDGRRDGDRHTGVFVWAEVIHLTARPENGIPDPHLHSHCYVFNTTWDSEEGRWKALQMFHAHRLAADFDTIVMHRLAENLRKIGVPIVETAEGFEVAGIEKEFRDKFSRRTKSIEEEARRRGITDPLQKAKLAALTREKKVKNLPVAVLERYWWGSLLPEEKAVLKGLETLLKRSRAMELTPTAGLYGTETWEIGKEMEAARSALGQISREWVEGDGKAKGRLRVSLNRATAPVVSPFREPQVTSIERKAARLAVEHVFERKSVVQEEELMAAGLRTFCIGKTTVEGVRKALSEVPLLRKEQNGITYFTTREVLAEERRIVEECRLGKGKCQPMNPFWEVRDEELTQEQQAAVTSVLNSKDLMVGIRGNPGVGKTRTLKELKRGIESGGYQLVTLAPRGTTAHDVLRKEGFEGAETVAKLLASRRLQAEAKGAVWLIDEAGQLSARETVGLIDLGRQLNARLIFAGDVGQHRSVRRGQAYDLLQKYGGMEMAEITAIQRQTGDYRKFVELVLEERLETAFDLADSMGSLQEMPAEEREVALAREYVEALQRGETVAGVSPTHAECDAVTERIRAALKENGMLKGGVERNILKDLKWTEAQKSDPEHYKPGMVVKINGHVRNFAIGERVEVIGQSDDVVKVRRTGGFLPEIKTLPLKESGAFSVHERDKIEICGNEKIRITANGKTKDGHQLTNGSEYIVDHVSFNGDLVLKNGWRLGHEFQHLAHNYMVTSHSIQGKTVDRVLISESSMTCGAADFEQFLVSTTRARLGFKIITDDKEWLLDTVSASGDRMMASELYPLMRAAEHLGTREAPAMEMEIKTLSRVREREREEERAMVMGM